MSAVSKFLQISNRIARRLGCNAPIKILYIDDRQVYSNHIKEALDKFYYTVDLAYNETQAEQLINNTQYDALLVSEHVKDDWYVKTDVPTVYIDKNLICCDYCDYNPFEIGGKLDDIICENLNNRHCYVEKNLLKSQQHSLI